MAAQPQPTPGLDDNGDVPPIELHHRIRATLEYRGMEPEDLAKVLGKHVNTVHNYIAGRTTPGRSVILHIALACRVSPKWLETGAQAEHGEPPFPPKAVDPNRAGSTSDEGAGPDDGISSSGFRALRLAA